MNRSKEFTIHEKMSNIFLKKKPYGVVSRVNYTRETGSLLAHIVISKF